MTKIRDLYGPTSTYLGVQADWIYRSGEGKNRKDPKKQHIDLEMLPLHEGLKRLLRFHDILHIGDTNCNNYNELK